MMVPGRRSRNVTVNGRDIGRRAQARAGARRASGTAALLAASLVLSAGCASESKGFYDREARVKFVNLKDADHLHLGVTDEHHQPIGEEDLDGGVTGVKLRFSGVTGMIYIKITIHYASGDECTIEVMADLEKADEVVVTIPLVCPTPPPDAGPPPTPTPDAGPDATPDLGPPPDCEKYCMVMHDHCPSVYLSPAECLTTCHAFGWPNGPEQSVENDLSCRMMIAMAAPTPDALNFCLAAGPSGGTLCGNICDNVCKATALVCPMGVAACLATPCDKNKAGPIRAESGDTAECRVHWLTVAAQDQGQSCARLLPESPDYPCH